jgi:hypothetical protein
MPTQVETPKYPLFKVRHTLLGHYQAFRQELISDNILIDVEFSTIMVLVFCQKIF